MIGRRTFLEITGGAAVAAVVAACRASSGPHNEAARLRVMLNGGIYEELARRLVIDPFEKETGGRVDVVPASSAQIITRLLAERAAPSVDVVVVDQLVMGKAIDEGVFERVEPGNVPHMRDLAPEAIDARGFGPVVHSHNLVLGFNIRLLSVDPPRAWADLWDTRFKGLVVPGAIGLTPGLLFLLQANSLNGGTYENVDPGFAALARLRPNVRKYFQNIGEVRPLVSQDNVIVAISSNMLQVEIAQGRPRLRTRTLPRAAPHAGRAPS